MVGFSAKERGWDKGSDGGGGKRSQWLLQIQFNTSIHQLTLKDVVLGFLHLAGNGKPNQRRIRVLNYQEIIQIVLEAQGTRGLGEDMRMGGMKDMRLFLYY
ncbi:hypothetical protein M0R45_024466 [Rubus argutus]|uniref:Uncharacterized protein n=1 Tax=Rubus argutus TaxID=59490 RepID=A0AAW1WT62_RUBAR